MYGRPKGVPVEIDKTSKRTAKKSKPNSSMCTSVERIHQTLSRTIGEGYSTIESKP